MQIFYDGLSQEQINALPYGAEFSAVYSPSGTMGNWHRTYFRVVKAISTSGKPLPTYEVLKEETLTPEEIKHFERLLSAQG
jgi:hypothetical protein